MPDGAEGPFFYEKTAPSHTPDWIHRCTVLSDDAKAGRIDYLTVDDTATLLYVANLGCIEMHPLHSRCDDVAHPDYFFFDLDPFEPYTYEDVLTVARHIKVLLDQLGPGAGDEAARRFDAAVEIERGDHRLAGVGEDGRIAAAARILLPAGQGQIWGKSDLRGHLREALARDEHREAPGEIALLLLGEAAVDKIRHHEPENAVAEKLQPLIGDAPAPGGAGMGEGKTQKRGVGEAMAEGVGQVLHRVLAPSAHSTALKSRDQRIAIGQRHNSQSSALPSTEKKRISARPTRFSAGIGPMKRLSCELSRLSPITK